MIYCRLFQLKNIGLDYRAVFKLGNPSTPYKTPETPWRFGGYTFRFGLKRWISFADERAARDSKRPMFRCRTFCCCDTWFV